MVQTLKDLRKESGLSQDTVALRLRKSQFCYSVWERGLTKIPIDAVEPLAVIFNKTENEVYQALKNTIKGDNQSETDD